MHEAAPAEDEPVGFFGWLAGFMLDHRPISVLVLGTLVLAVCMGITFLGVDFNAKAFYATQDPEGAFLVDYSSRWKQDDLMVVTVEGAEGESVLTAERLAVIGAVRASLAAEPSVGSAQAITDLKRTRMSLFGPSVRDLVDDIPDTPESLERWQTEILSDSAVVPSLLSQDGRYTAILLSIDEDTDDLSVTRDLVRDIGEVIAPYQNKEGLTLLLAGIPSLRGSVIDAIVLDQLRLVPISAVLVLLLLVLMFRSRHGVLVPVTAAVVPLGMLLGAMGYLGHTVGMLNQTYLILIPAIAIADAIHLVSRYHEESRHRTEVGAPHTRQSRRQAIVAAMRHMGLACFLTSFTTIVGFVSLSITDMEVLRKYGLYAALGIFCAYFTVLFIVPLALSTTRRAAPLSSQNQERWVGKLLSVCADLSYRHPKYRLM